MNPQPLVIETVAIASLVEDPQNARIHGEQNLKAIKDSLASHGQVEPLVVLKANRRVLGGNGRLQAMKVLGWTEAGVIFVDIPESRARALALALNRTAELAAWDFSVLADTLQEIDTGEFDVPSMTGFDDEELKRIMNWTPKNEKDETEPIPEPPVEAISKIGDLWEMDGRHRLLCGDSTKMEDVARVMGSEKAALVNTDPPYGIAYNSAALHDNKTEYAAIESDELNGEALQAFLESSIRACLPFVRENAAWYLWHPMLTQGTFFAAAAAAAADILISRQIIWVKPQLIFGRGEYHWKHELCFYGWVRGHRPEFYGERNQTTVWEIAYAEGRNEREHPTQKPVRLFEIPIENHTKQGDVIYEPFSGSGSQFIAAEKLGRRCFGLDIIPAYVDVTIRRWQNLVGLKARNLTRPEVVIA